MKAEINVNEVIRDWWESDEGDVIQAAELWEQLTRYIEESDAIFCVNCRKWVFDGDEQWDERKIICPHCGYVLAPHPGKVFSLLRD